jgi:hypothetical protein
MRSDISLTIGRRAPDLEHRAFRNVHGRDVERMAPGVIPPASTRGSRAALADQAPGQLGYEGQPGNQGGASGNPGGGQPPGLLGYEGQPGNQGGH